MDNKDFTNLGEQIKSAVQDAVTSMDFKKLNQEIRSTVDGALDEVRRTLQDSPEKIKNEAKKYQKNITELRRNDSKPANRTLESEEKLVKTPKQEIYSELKKPVGRVAGILYTVFGSIGTGTLGILFIIFFLLTVNGWGFGVFTFLILLPFLLVCIFMMGNGIRLQKRVGRFRKYAKHLGSRSFVEIKELAGRTGRTEKYIRKDLIKMIRKGMFPEGHLDENRTYFMLNYDTYKQYTEMRKNYRERELNQKAIEEEQKKAALPKKEGEQSTTNEGKEYIQKIRMWNGIIKDREISNKLDKLELVTSKIFYYVEQHPEQMPEIRKFMEYYLPTTMKLVTAYAEFDAQPIQGDNITSAKKEIQETLDTINQAFANLLDSLFEDAAMDISTDISVMKTMLAQEGLTEEDQMQLKN